MTARLVIVAALAAALAAGAPAGAAGGASGGKGKAREVGVFSDFYDPSTLTVHVGDKVTWVWHVSGFDLHDVTVDAGPAKFHSPTQASGRFSFRFKKAGTYRLLCTEHEEDMTMTVKVKQARR